MKGSNYISARTPMVPGMRRRRGMGQASAPYGGIAPGSPCYDASHDGGIIHCAGITNVLLDSLPFGPSATTTCSAAEMQCFQNAANALAANPDDPNAAAVLNGGAAGGAGGANPASTPDACTAAIGFSCSTVAIAVAAVLGLLMLAPLMTAGRRY